MMNAHDLTSHSRFAHAQRLSEAVEYRLAKVATSNEPHRAERRNVLKDLLATIVTHVRIARAQA